MNITNPDELFRRIDEFRIRAEIEERAEQEAIQAVVAYLRSLKETRANELALNIEHGAWKRHQR